MKIPVRRGFILSEIVMMRFYSLLFFTFFATIFSGIVQAQLITGDDNIAMYEDTPTTHDILENDQDNFSGINAATVDLDVSTPQIDQTFTSPDGNYSVNSSGILTFEPALNFFGVTTHSYTVQNNGILGLFPTTSRSTLITITVDARNDPPVISAHLPLTTAESTALTIQLSDLTVTDPDTDASLFILQVQDGPNYSRSGNTITPNANFSGALTANVVVSDQTDPSVAFPITVNVTSVNSVPTITAASTLTTAEETPLSLVITNFTVTDSDPGDTFTLKVLDGTGYSRAGNVITPDPNFNGDLLVRVVAFDGTADSPEFLAPVSVTPVNDPPVITGQLPLSTNEATPLLIRVSDLTIADPDNSSFTLFVQTGSNYDLVGNTITPHANFNGTLKVAVIVSDNNPTDPKNSAQVDLDVSVLAVNSAPTISAINQQTTAENTATAPIQFTVGDLDNNVQDLTVSATSSNTTLVVNTGFVFGGTGANRNVIITPVNNQSGVTTITVTVRDQEKTATSSFQLTVTSVNEAPTITAITDQTTQEDVSTAAIPFTIGDADSAIPDLTVTGSSSNQTLVRDANISFTGTDISRAVTIAPAGNQNGSTTITLTVSDGISTKTTAFLVTVTPVNDAPTITAITNQTTSENVPTGALPFTVNDIDSDVATLVVTGNSSNTTVVPDDRITFGGSGAARTVTVNPVAGQNGATTLTIHVGDGSLTASTSFQLTITSVNDAPTITAVGAQTIREDEATAALPFTIGDAETPAASLTVVGNSSNKNIVPDANIVFGGSGATRTVTVKPAANQNGDVIITLTVSDQSTSKQITFPVIISPVNDAPVITGQFPLSTSEETPLAIVADNLIVADPDGDKNFKVTVHSGEKYTYTGTATIRPVDDFDGVLTVNVSVNDGTTESATFPLQVTVRDVNLPPTILSQNPKPIEIEENRSFSLNTNHFRITDPENAPPTGFKLAVSEGNNYSLSGAQKNVITPLPNYKGPLDVTVTVNDGKNESLPFKVDIVVVPRSDTSRIVGQEALVTNEDEPITLKLEDFTITGSATNYTMSIVDGSNYTVSGLTVTPALNVNGILEVGIQVRSGNISSTVFKAQLYVVPVNDAPQILTMETEPIQYEPGTGPVSITQVFDCDDIDNEFLNFAEVGLLDSSYSPSNDELIFESNDTSRIRGIYDASRGVLSLIGYASPEEYQLAIRSIKYNYRLTLDENGERSQISTDPKKVYVELSDGQLLSEKHERAIELETSVDLDIPTAFTPNGDPVNNTWAVRPVTNIDQFDKTIIRVYNKRGIMVYESVGFEKEWDGTFNGEILPVDTYYYTIDLQLSFTSKTYKGAVTILR